MLIRINCHWTSYRTSLIEPPSLQSFCAVLIIMQRHRTFQEVLSKIFWFSARVELCTQVTSCLTSSRDSHNHHTGFAVRFEQSTMTPDNAPLAGIEPATNALPHTGGCSAIE